MEFWTLGNWFWSNWQRFLSIFIHKISRSPLIFKLNAHLHNSTLNPAWKVLRKLGGEMFRVICKKFACFSTGLTLYAPDFAVSSVFERFRVFLRWHSISQCHSLIRYYKQMNSNFAIKSGGNIFPFRTPHFNPGIGVKRFQIQNLKNMCIINTVNGRSTRCRGLITSLILLHLYQNWQQGIVPNEICAPHNSITGTGRQAHIRKSVGSRAA